MALLDLDAQQIDLGTIRPWRRTEQDDARETTLTRNPRPPGSRHNNLAVKERPKLSRSVLLLDPQLMDGNSSTFAIGF